MAAGVPLSLLDKVGYWETWDAFNVYQQGVLDLSQTHPVRVPAQGDRVRNYTRVDRDLIGWQKGINTIYGRISQMAVVGAVSDSDGVEFEFYRPGSPQGDKKGVFHAKRDLSVLLYFVLSAATYFSESVHLALVVLNLNLLNIAICLRLKGMGDAIGKAVEELKDAQQAFLLLPMEATLLELLQQQMCLEKMAAIINDWLSAADGSGTELGMSITLPYLRTVTLSTSTMASLAAATTVRAIHVIVYGFIPGLPRIRWRQMLGSMGAYTARLQHQATDLQHSLRHSLSRRLSDKRD
ncbi:hypothetical protein N2152v2_006031 [Parachlorella kessleri]